MNVNYNCSQTIKFIQSKLRNIGFILMVFLSLKPIAFYAQQSFTFTPCGATGAGGPTQLQVNNTYSGPNSLNGSVAVTGQGIQQFTVPTTGVWIIEARGARGYNPSGFGGRGAIMKGEFNLTAGNVLKIVVGQEGQVNPASGTLQFGGGGGSFVALLNNTPLIVAGGGGGSHATSYTPSSADGTVSTTGNTAVGSSDAPGGTGGGGGAAIASANGGAGFNGDGGGTTGPALSFTNGALGGNLGAVPYANGGIGGFGGGGGTQSWNNNRGGGGGGYSGGGGASLGQPSLWGGGGGSYNNGTNQVNLSGANTASDGIVILTEACNISIMSSSSGTVSPATLCSGNSLTLTTNAISNYSWSTGQTTSSIIVAPTTNTVYQITATSSLACTATGIMNVAVSSGVPVLSISTSTNNTCLGKTVTLTATGALTYSWTNGVVNGVSYAPSVTNTYTVTGQNGCGTSTAVTSITVAPLQVSAISQPTIVCAGSPSTLSAVSAGTSYTWYPNSPTSATTVVGPTVSTVYTVTVSDGTCSGVTTVSLAVNPIPTISIVASTSVVCAGNPVTLTAMGGINYTWTPANLPQTSVVTVNPNGPTLYSVIGDNSVSCTSGANQVVVTNPSPTVNIAPTSTLICLGDAVTLMASGSATSYAWVNGPATANYNVSPTSSTIYTLVGTGGSGNSCTTTKTATIDVFSPVLTIAVAPSTTVCAGTSVTLTASGTDGFNWVNGPPLPEHYVSPNATAIYTVTGNTSTLSLICSVTKTVQITVNPNPTVTATSTRTDICKGEAAILNAGGAPSFSWSSGDLTSVATVIHNSFGIFTYSVTGTNANNCKHMATIQIKVNTCGGVTSSEFANAQQLIIFPNPSKGEFFVESDVSVTVDLVNEIGQKISTIKLGASNNYKTKVSGLNSGIYFLSGFNSDIKVHQKIIVD